MDKNATQVAPMTQEKVGGRFFTRLDWSAFLVAWLASFAGYFYTLAPTVTLEDSGELATAGAFWGVPHPPGYPIWSIFANLFSRVFAFVTYMGQPNPAWAIGFMSAFFGSLATGLTALLICRSGRDILQAARGEAHAIDASSEKLFCWAGGVAASLVFAFTSINWSQSVIVEVYSLNAFFLVLVMVMAYKWIRQPSDNLLIGLSFVFGVGLTNYQAILLMLPALMILVLVRDLKLLRDFVIVGIPFVAAIKLMDMGMLPQMVHPLHPSGLIYITLNFVLLALAFFLLPRGRTVALCVLAAEVGLAVYAYMPLSSETNPPMNWGYPRTWEGFKHAISRGQYEKIVPTNVFSIEFIHQMGDYLQDLRAQFTVVLAALGLIPFTIWKINGWNRRIHVGYLAIVTVFAAVSLVVIEEVLVPSGIPAVSFVYKCLIAAVLLLLTIGTAALFIREGEELVDTLVGRTAATISERITVGLILLGVVFIALFLTYSLGMAAVEATAPLRQPNAPWAAVSLALKKCAGIVLLIILPGVIAGITYVLIYKGPRLTVTIDRDSQKWFVATLSSFLVMSFLFIALANPKGDIQDYFIQRVKYISSHALYAFWVGYGMIFGLTFTTMLFRGMKVIKWAGFAVVLLTPLIPIKENAWNKEQIRIVGGAEQNGHDFGWQFGNYQLRGAEAILEELSADEEPLPNPMFPPEMGPNAVFFGGTDPGRFVPTYMIYSAKVREDVYLITQNALADNTYMAVMRDLYGDQIWIPSQVESASAFQRYVEEVRAGKRPQNAELKIEGGRVQVSGALGVMEINGILCQMIFERNNYKHPFYVEESYVIRWMYPYLSPHGLIMKINANALDLSPRMAREDMDFWDWYTRRLLANPGFIRDICARKSFSKLRSAIAGLYAARGRFGEAEEAYQEARALYSLSPEANFRLAQEVYLSRGQFGPAKEVITQFSKEDPGNRQALSFRGQIESFEKTAVRVNDLESKIPGGRLSVDEALELCDLFIQIGQIPKMIQMATTIVANTNLPPVYHFRAAALCQKGGRPAEMLQALDQFFARVPADTPAEAFIDATRMYLAGQRPDRATAALDEYLRRRPQDWKAWLDQSSLQLGLNRTNMATKSLEAALRIGGSEAQSFAVQNPAFRPILNDALRRAQSLMGMPMAEPPRPQAQLW